MFKPHKERKWIALSSYFPMFRQTDFQRLTHPVFLQDFLVRLEQAQAVGDRAQVVRVYSFVRLLDQQRLLRTEFQLVPPHQHCPERGLVSISSPMGMEVIGRKLGARVTIDSAQGRQCWMIEAINTSYLKENYRVQPT